MLTLTSVAMFTPLKAIWEEIEISSFDAAPERAEELGTLTKERGVRVFVDEGQGTFQFSVDPCTGQIKVELATLERLWAYCMAYGHVIHQSHQVSETGGLVALSSTPELLNSNRILHWAHIGRLKQVRLPWPDNLPKPVSRPERHSFLELANGLFRKTLGWILLHEVGHVVLCHQPSSGRPLPELVEEEKQADRWATEWILHDGERRAKEATEDFVLRTLGITCALSLFTTFEVYDRTGGVTHPDPPDRLWNFLTEFVPYQVAKPVSPAFAWFAAASIVKLHLAHGGVTLDERSEYSDSKAYLADLLYALKRHQT